MNELFGLVVCGGESSRMGMDKSQLVYYQKSQNYHLYEMLKPFCIRVFISCNKKQSTAIDSYYEKIIDFEEYQNLGPIAALLSAFLKFPDKDFIVLGCDYPFLKISDIQKLIDEKDNNHKANSFYNNLAKTKEPLLAYYSSECYPKLLEYYENKNYSLKQFLNEIDSKDIHPESKESIMSIDTPEAYHEALLLIREMSGNKLTHTI